MISHFAHPVNSDNIQQSKPLSEFSSDPVLTDAISTHFVFDDGPLHQENLKLDDEMVSDVDSQPTSAKLFRFSSDSSSDFGCAINGQEFVTFSDLQPMEREGDWNRLDLADLQPNTVSIRADRFSCGGRGFRGLPQTCRSSTAAFGAGLLISSAEAEAGCLQLSSSGPDFEIETTKSDDYDCTSPSRSLSLSTDSNDITNLDVQSDSEIASNFEARIDTSFTYRQPLPAPINSIPDLRSPNYYFGEVCGGLQAQSDGELVQQASFSVSSLLPQTARLASRRNYWFGGVCATPRPVYMEDSQCLTVSSSGHGYRGTFARERHSGQKNVRRVFSQAHERQLYGSQQVVNYQKRLQSRFQSSTQICNAESVRVSYPRLPSMVKVANSNLSVASRLGCARFLMSTTAPTLITAPGGFTSSLSSERVKPTPSRRSRKPCLHNLNLSHDLDESDDNEEDGDHRADDGDDEDTFRSTSHTLSQAPYSQYFQQRTAPLQVSACSRTLSAAQRSSHSDSGCGATLTGARVPRQRICSRLGGRRRHLLSFILELLSLKQNCVEWVNKSDKVFQIVNPEQLTRLWGEYKNNKKMTFESLSRSLRLYYAPGKLERISGLRHHYRLLYPSLPDDAEVELNENSEPTQTVPLHQHAQSLASQTLSVSVRQRRPTYRHDSNTTVPCRRELMASTAAASLSSVDRVGGGARNPSVGA